MHQNRSLELPSECSEDLEYNIGLAVSTCQNEGQDVRTRRRNRLPTSGLLRSTYDMGGGRSAIGRIGQKYSSTDDNQDNNGVREDSSFISFALVLT